MGMLFQRLPIGKLITLEQAKKYERDSKYKDYIFPVIELKNGKIMCRPQRMKNNMNINKNEKANNFKEYISGKGKYKGIDRKVSEGKINYNNWQSAKRYRPEQYTK